MANTSASTVDDERRDDRNDERTPAGLERARTIATMLDEAVRVPGTQFRVGVDPLLGVAPVSGDALAALGSLYIVLEALRLEVPAGTVARMLLAIGAEFVVGSIPILGTLIDAGWKVNKSNVELIEAHLDE